MWLLLPRKYLPKHVMNTSVGGATTRLMGAITRASMPPKFFILSQSTHYDLQLIIVIINRTTRRNLIASIVSLYNANLKRFEVKREKISKT